MFHWMLIRLRMAHDTFCRPAQKLKPGLGPNCITNKSKVWCDRCTSFVLSLLQFPLSLVCSWQNFFFPALFPIKSTWRFHLSCHNNFNDSVVHILDTIIRTSALLHDRKQKQTTDILKDQQINKPMGRCKCNSMLDSRPVKPAVAAWFLRNSSKMEKQSISHSDCSPEMNSNVITAQGSWMNGITTSNCWI